MASTYYDSSGKEVVDGNVAYATDLNDINSAIDTAFQQVESDITTVSSNQSYYADLAEKWAENPEDSAVTPGKYSALHWAAKAADDKVLTAADVVQTGLDKSATAADRVNTNNDKIATAADRVQTGLDKTATAADRVQTGLDRTAAAGSAVSASNSAIAAAAVVAEFPTLGAADQGKYLKVSNPYTDGYETATIDLSAYAPLASPALTGNPTAPTQTAGNNSTRLATTAFTTAAIAALVLTKPLTHVQDQKAYNVDGGTSIADAWTKRTLNTIIVNQISGASLASDNVTLPAGTYYIEASFINFGPGIRATIASIYSGSTKILQGPTITSQIGNSIIAGVSGTFTLSGSDDISLRYYTGLAEATSGNGQSNSNGSITDAAIVSIYADLKVWKL